MDHKNTSNHEALGILTFYYVLQAVNFDHSGVCKGKNRLNSIATDLVRKTPRHLSFISNTTTRQHKHLFWYSSVAQTH